MVSATDLLLSLVTTEDCADGIFTCRASALVTQRVAQITLHKDRHEVLHLARCTALETRAYGVLDDCGRHALELMGELRGHPCDLVLGAHVPLRLTVIHRVHLHRGPFVNLRAAVA